MRARGALIRSCSTLASWIVWAGWRGTIGPSTLTWPRTFRYCQVTLTLATTAQAGQAQHAVQQDPVPGLGDQQTVW